MSATTNATKIETFCLIVSLLDEPATGGAATRPWRGGTVLAATLDRLRTFAGRRVVLAWDDQAGDVATLDAEIRFVGPRAPTAAMLQRGASLRWSDGWRGGLLGYSEFDRGFHAEAILNAMGGDDAAILVSLAAALIEAQTIDRLAKHLAGPASAKGFAFVAGAPGSGGFAITRPTLEALAKLGRGPGSLLRYHPDRVEHDPLARESALPVPAIIARSSRRVSVDSDRQHKRLSLTQRDASIEEALASLAAHREVDATPREVVLEVTPRRATRPIWSLASHFDIDRSPISLDAAKRVFSQLGSIDDVRLTLAGVGDPLLHSELPAILDAARDRGIAAVHVETDLLPDDPAILESIIDRCDVLSVHMPAITRPTYFAAMGVDRLDAVLGNLKALVVARGARGALPIVVPAFQKLAINLGEMEVWYDQWLRAVGAAVIAGPPDHAGQIADCGVADLSPPMRRACRSLDARLMILSDGTIVACEQDGLGRSPLGHIERDAISDVWNEKMRPMRDAHRAGRWGEAGPLCAGCRAWDRP